VIDEFAKEYLHNDLRQIRAALHAKLDGLSEYDIRRPLTSTGTNLLGLVKHQAVSESRYFGLVFDRPCPEPVPAWDDEAADDTDFWARADETREDVIGFCHRVWEHSDATIKALPIDAPGYVPWWRDEVKLLNIMVHVLVDAARHAGHADILREQLDGAVGWSGESVPRHGHDEEFWAARRAEIERAAQEAAGQAS
jgi:hypothetical protein